MTGSNTKQNSNLASYSTFFIKLCAILKYLAAKMYEMCKNEKLSNKKLLNI